MTVYLPKVEFLQNKTTLNLSGSKSETNRLLILKAIYPEIEIENTSTSDDALYMQEALIKFNLWKKNGSDPSEVLKINIHHAGTAMRFLTSFFASQPNLKAIITGSSRMEERPILILVEGLKSLGTNIKYLKKVGFPPLFIEGQKILANEIYLKANVSSQYITSILNIAPSLKNGLKINLDGECTSFPYISMTINLLKQLGVEVYIKQNTIMIMPFNANKILCKRFVVESDWSSASYWYSIVALAEIGFEITLNYFKKNSLQGDSILAKIYEQFGVKTSYNTNKSITLFKIHNDFNHFKNTYFKLNLNNTPDIAQTIAVTCFGLKIACKLTGLHTLKIKETDRLEALKTELLKLGAVVTVNSDSLTLEASHLINKDVVIKTYQDHRMAMAFTPLMLRTSLYIENASVVTKSYINFWEDLKKL